MFMINIPNSCSCLGVQPVAKLSTPSPRFRLASSAPNIPYHIVYNIMIGWMAMVSYTVYEMPNISVTHYVLTIRCEVNINPNIESRHCADAVTQL